MKINLPTNLKNKVKFLTATALFDGHDASINIIRRLLQQKGVEVVHLGHNRSVQEIVTAAIQEDVHAICVSSYQGGHMEFFQYMREVCDSYGRPDLNIFGGGGGVILPHEIEALQNLGITRIYSPDDGFRLGLSGMIDDMLCRSDYALDSWPSKSIENLSSNYKLSTENPLLFSRALTMIENGKNSLPNTIIEQLQAGQKNVESMSSAKLPLVLGITGTGGAGKSSLTDELLHRFLLEFPEKTFCVLSIDPSKKKTGGALLGDRIRMNAVSNYSQVFMRSFATRGARGELSAVIQDAVALARSAGFSLILVETSGIGQGDTGILNVADLSLYVMTSEFGAPTQLEKIDMLDFADAIAINKFDKRGSEDAFREVKTTLRRSRFRGKIEEQEDIIFGTVASQFHDDGVNALYRFIVKLLAKKTEQAGVWKSRLKLKESQKSSHAHSVIPQTRCHYLSEIAATVRQYRKETRDFSKVAEELFCLQKTKDILGLVGEKTDEKISQLWQKLPSELADEIKTWPKRKASYAADFFEYSIRNSTYRVKSFNQSLSGLKIKKVVLPEIENYGDLVKFLRTENTPGSFPFTAGVFPFKRADEDPKRQFAGEGGPARTNQRFHFLTENDKAKRLSTAFDSVTLYGSEPARQPDIYGKVGESGVSIATLDDMKILYSGFDLCHPTTSVSMTINGPAPILLAFYFNTAIDQQVDAALIRKGEPLTDEELQQIRANALRTVRGTVQADILKEDQAQNTCIFSIDFALKMMGDIQDFFIRHEVRNYYSVSISGYHIAEAGANPIHQLAFTLANGFTYVEYYLSRGMSLDDFAPNLAFFFSNGMDPEYSVIGRVARRIWAIALRDLYKGNERSQKLKYHIQTSGRSLHAKEMNFNDTRTTLQALLAFADNCNSLHTNAYDEAITTPTQESVRRSMAIQMILTQEFGLLKNENLLQGSYFIEALTDAVEEAVLEVFDRLSERGGVLGAMENHYQRSQIQEDSLYYETLKHSGEYPIVGINTFLKEEESIMTEEKPLHLSRASYAEKDDQLERLECFKTTHQNKAAEALKNLQQVVLQGGNVFEELLVTTRYASLGQITQALYEVGGRYRRAM